MQRKVYSIQIDEGGHQRIERVAEHYMLTQAGAASVVVRAATDKMIKREMRKLAHQQGDTTSRVTRTTEVPRRAKPSRPRERETAADKPQPK